MQDEREREREARARASANAQNKKQPSPRVRHFRLECLFRIVDERDLIGTHMSCARALDTSIPRSNVARSG
jgi:hypothetical protein